MNSNNDGAFLYVDEYKWAEFKAKYLTHPKLDGSNFKQFATDFVDLIIPEMYQRFYCIDLVSSSHCKLHAFVERVMECKLHVPEEVANNVLQLRFNACLPSNKQIGYNASSITTITFA